jgi:hypothetical protein
VSAGLIVPPVRPLWSLPSAGPIRGLSLARERGWLLAWDANSCLTLFNHAGDRQGMRQLPGALTAACAAEDGSAFAAAGAAGEVWLLAPDLSTTWERRAAQKALAVALEPFGQLLVVADAGGAVQVLDSRGEPVWRADSPRPLQYLAFVPEKPLLLGAADFGLVACFDRTGQFTWRDGLVAHVGSLACDGPGMTVVLACFNEGLHRYSASAGQPRRTPLAVPCRLAGLSYDGNTLVTIDLEGRVQVRRSDGQLREEHAPPSPAVALAVAALADRVYLALGDGTLQALEWTPPTGGKPA